jgi:iron complex transport system ATP-binding protein
MKKNKKRIQSGKAMAILEVTDLCAGYGNGNIIHNITFSLNKGESLCILGRNGSGKSTLIKAVQGLLKDLSGEVKVNGRNLLSLKPQEIARLVAYVPQLFSLSFAFTVIEIILMGRYIHQGKFTGASSKDMNIIRDIMDLTEVSHLREKKIAHLSGGERQRVFIARALAQDTPLLFLDEPSSHLDISYQMDIYHILKRLQEEKGKTILAAEHNINLAVPFSQRLLFLKEGKIHSLGHPRELITKQNIREVYQADVDIRENLHSGLPEVSLTFQKPEY